MSYKEAIKVFSEQEHFDDYLVTEYLPNEEYTIDTFRSAKTIISIPRKRTRIRSGISFETQIETNQKLIDYSNKLALLLDLKYCFGFQFKYDDEGTPKILECNPRVQGTMIASVLAGFNLIFYSIAEALNIPYTLESNINMQY